LWSNDDVRPKGLCLGLDQPHDDEALAATSRDLLAWCEHQAL
jgi:hypothetical protein